MRHILVVDDDPDVGDILSEYLTGEGFDVAVASDAAAARDELAQSRPDVVLLDLMLGDEDGLALGREIHQIAIPFLIVSGRREPVDRVVGLEMGADDFVTKPFDLRELLARIRSVLRRATGPAPERELESSQALHFEGWRLDLVAYELTDPGGKDIQLTSTEMALLEAFARHPGRVLTRERISEDVLRKSWIPGDRSVDMLVSRLRSKIEHDADRPHLIKTRRNLGYAFTASVTPRP